MAVLSAQVVSQAEAAGKVLVASLAEIQGSTFDSPVVLVAEKLDGTEDIPVGLGF
jgi:hypothetical protein